MAEAIRYYMDQHFPDAVSKGLRRIEIDVLTAQDAGRCGLPDSEQLAFARSDNRVMVTFDSDFLSLHRAGVEHAGIAWCPLRKYGIGMLIQLLELPHGTVDRDQMRNRLEHL